MRKTTRRKVAGRLVLATVLLLALVVTTAMAWRIYPYSLLSHPRAERHDEGDHGYVPTAAAGRDFDVSAPQAFVYDVTAGEIVWQKGESRVVYPASTTKLWSALCALQHLSPETVVTVGDEVSLIDPESSRAYISAGQRLTVEMLIEGMLLPSGNDAAYALAAAVGRKLEPTVRDAAAAVEVFVAEMNRYARESGLCGTTFTTPDGLADREHYTTVEDMILVCRMALEQPLIARYAAMAEDHVTYESGETITWRNTNRLLHPDSAYYRPDVIGLKTGSLEHNFCVIAACRSETTTYIVGIFGAWDTTARFEDACAVLDGLCE